MEQLTVAGAWLHVPAVHTDHRGTFHEAFRGAEFETALGRPLNLAQANVSVSHRGVIRGIHFAEVPPGQAKYITCLRGAVFDVAVDLRLDSPGFGTWQGVELSDQNRRSLYLAEGLGHAFMALTDDATVMYLCSRAYDPAHEHGIHPLDPELAITWPDSGRPDSGRPPVLSEKDAAAPSLSEALAQGLLPERRKL